MHRLVDVARTYTRSVVDRYLADGTTAGTIAAAALAKQTAVEACDAVVDRCVQLYGGAGYLHGTEVERHYRDARILPIGGGATEVMTDLAAKLLGYEAMTQIRSDGSRR
jgi:acyl-CoA dehydrogenase